MRSRIVRTNHEGQGKSWGIYVINDEELEKRNDQRESEKIEITSCVVMQHIQIYTTSLRFAVVFSV